MYDDCRDAYGQISTGGLRIMLADSMTVPSKTQVLAALSDNDVRAMVSLGCFVLAAGAVAPFDGVWDDLLIGG